MHILVTGGLGFVGTNFLQQIPLQYPNDFFYTIDKNVYNVDISNWLETMPENVELIVGDITKYDMVLSCLEEYEIEMVIHFAAESHVDKSFQNSLNFTYQNVYGTHVLLEACRNYGTKLQRFIHMSTDEVYGDVPMDAEPCTPTNKQLDPTNPYAATKTAAEYIVKSYGYSYKLPYVIVRCTNLYGPSQYPDKVVPLFIKQMIEQKPIHIHGEGTATRRYLYIDDLIMAFPAIMYRVLIGAIIQVGSSNEYTTLQVAHQVEYTLNMTIGVTYKVEREFIEDRLYNDMRYALDTTEMEMKYGWIEKTPFAFGLKKTIEWYQQNQWKRWID